MRDGTVAGYLPPLPYGGGYLVYKQGQSAMRFMVERYGEDRLRDMLQKLKFHRELRPRVRELDGHHGGQVRRGVPVLAARRRTGPAWPTATARSSSPAGSPTTARDRSNINMAAGGLAAGRPRRVLLGPAPVHGHLHHVGARREGPQARDPRRARPAVRERSVVPLAACRGRRTASASRSSPQAQARDVLYVVDADKEGKVLRRISSTSTRVSYPTLSPIDDTIVVRRGQERAHATCGWWTSRAR